MADFGNFEFLRQLTETPGIPGREERVRDLLLEQTRDMWDEVETDLMGNLICVRRAGVKQGRKGVNWKHKVPRVMVACHMDEIGFYVRSIDENGYLKLHNAGGFDTRNLFARQVLVHGKTDLLGVMNPGGKPVHISTQEERNRIPEVKDFMVDLFMPKNQVRRAVEVGDPVTLVQRTEMVNDAITGKAMDNRVALWAGVNAVRKACGLDYLVPGGGKRRNAKGSSSKLKYDVYFVACVQEEVGLRGATTAAYSIDPDIGLAIDTTLCCDTPGVSRDDAVTEFGKGVGLKVMDGASISHRGLFEEFVAVAKKKRITHQREVLPRGGTDAGAVQRARTGNRALTLSIPTRYIHTVTEAIHKKDAQAAVELLAAWLTT